MCPLKILQLEYHNFPLVLTTCIQVEEVPFKMDHFRTFQNRPLWRWPWIRSYGILSIDCHSSTST